MYRLQCRDRDFSPLAAAGRLADLSADGVLNLARLQSALDFRIRFGLTPPLGPALRIPALCWGPLGGRQRLAELPDGGIYFLGK